MTTELPNGSLVFSPEETVVALLEQGWTPEQIIADADQAIFDAEVGIMVVAAAANQQHGHHSASQTILAAASAALEPFSLDEVEHAGDLLAGNTTGPATPTSRALRRINGATLDTQMLQQEAALADAAAKAHRAQADETIGNARRRIAAANDPDLVKPAVERFAAAKKAEAEALKAAEK